MVICILKYQVTQLLIKNTKLTVMEDMSIVTESELESQSFKDRKPSGDDPVSDWLLKTYYSLFRPNN